MKYKVSKDALFKLVKAMDNGEKRFFNLYCKRYNHESGKVYIKLFKAIESQQVYDASLLKQEIKGYGGNLPLVKSYLYSLLLDALLQYYNKGNNILPAKMIQIRLLYEKGLIDIALKLVYGVRLISERQNDFLIAIATIRWELILIEALGNFNKKARRDARVLEKNYIYLYNEIYGYRQLYHEVYEYALKYTLIYNKNVKNEFLKISNNPRFNSTGKAGSIMASVMLYMSRGLYYELLGDNEIAFKEFSYLMKIIDTAPLFKDNNFELSSTAIGYYITMCITLRKYEPGLKKVEEIKNLYKNHPTFRMKRLLFNCQMQELRMYFLLGNGNSLVNLISEMEDKIKRGEIITEINKNLFYCETAIYYTLLGNPDELLNWVNKLLGSPTLERRYQNIYRRTRILQIINLMELKEFDLLYYRLKSFRRYMAKEKIIYSYERIMVDFIRNMLKDVYNKEAQHSHYLHFKNSITKSNQNQIDALAASFFDFAGWIDSKIENISYMKLITLKPNLN